MILYGTKYDLRNLFDLMICEKEDECIAEWGECNLLEFITCISINNNINLKFIDVGKIKAVGTLIELYRLPKLLCESYSCGKSPEKCIACCADIFNFMYECQQ